MSQQALEQNDYPARVMIMIMIMVLMNMMMIMIMIIMRAVLTYLVNDPLPDRLSGCFLQLTPVKIIGAHVHSLEVFFFANKRLLPIILVKIYAIILYNVKLNSSNNKKN